MHTGVWDVGFGLVGLRSVLQFHGPCNTHINVAWSSHHLVFWCMHLVEVVAFRGSKLFLLPVCTVICSHAMHVQSRVKRTAVLARSLCLTDDVTAGINQARAMRRSQPAMVAHRYLIGSTGMDTPSQVWIAYRLNEEDRRWLGPVQTSTYDTLPFRIALLFLLCSRLSYHKAPVPSAGASLI